MVHRLNDWRREVLGAVVLASSGMYLPVAAAASDAGADVAPSSSGTLTEIVITAQRRSQNLQNVPIAVDAIVASDALQLGITGTTSLQTDVPSLSVSRQVNASVVFIRGIGTADGDANTETSVALYIDGVYQPSPFGNVFEFNDIQQIEVLKGPQGTLFGRSATGGVIQISTREPSHTPEAEVSLGYANYDTISEAFYGTTGITENLAGSLAAMNSDQNKGWGRNVLTGEQTRGERAGNVRGKLLYTPDESTDVHLEGDYAHNINMGITGQPAPGARTFNGLGDPGHFNVWSDGRDISDIESAGASLRVDHRFSDLRLASISAFRNTHGIFTYDQDLSPIPLVQALSGQSGRMFSQELHLLSSTSATFQWLVGAFYYDYHASEAPLNLYGLAFGPGDGITFENKSYLRSESLFGQATYPVLDDTNLTLGVRYTGDQIHYTGNTVIGGTSTSIDGGPIDKSFSYAKPTWRATLDHKLASDVLGYVSYNRGVKAGNIGLSVDATVAAPYQPEQLDAYELGLKSELFEHRIRLNAAIYDYDFKNFQYSKISNGSALIFNGPSAKSYGGELELLYVITENLTANANVGLEHTRIGNFPGAPNTQRLPDGLTNSGVAGYNAEGNQLPFAPKATANVGLMYKMPTAFGTYELGSNLYRFGGAYTEIDNRLKIDAFTLLSASLAWTAPGEAFNLKAWGKNLTNQYYAAQLTSQANGADLFSPAPPRTYGVTLGYKFK